MRYIDAEDVFNSIQKRLYQSAYYNVGIEAKVDEVFEDIAKNRLQQWVDEIPTADVNGEWVIDDASTEHCSVCGHPFYTSALFAVGGNDEPPYCPNCGAKM